MRLDLRRSLSFYETVRRRENLVEFGFPLRLLLIPVEPGTSAWLQETGSLMGAEPIRLEARHRSARMLRTALGEAIADWLADPQVIEIMLNPDGRLWVDRLGQGISASGQRLAPADGERIIRLVAHHVGAEVHAAAPNDARFGRANFMTGLLWEQRE